MSEPLDLQTLDRRLGRGQARVETELLRLRSVVHPSGDAAAQTPGDAKMFAADFGGIRDLAGQAHYQALATEKLGAHEELHRAGLMRWSYELVQLRVGWDLVVEDVEAMRAVDPKILERDRHRHPGEGDAIRSGVGEGTAPQAEAARSGPARSYAEALVDLVEAPHVHGAEGALRRLAELAPPVAAVRKELRARRFEVAARLGLAHPWDLAVTGGAGKLAALAEAILAATEPLAVALGRASARGAANATGGTAANAASSAVARAIFSAFARDAGEGWPARLGARWYGDVFRAIAPRSPKVPSLPRPLGAASFVRGAEAWGGALRLAGTARSLPFALARDPYATEAHVLGGAVAIALSGRVFAKRKLGLSARAADAQARVLARVLFTGLRRSAAALLAGMTASPDADRIEELSARVFGMPLGRALGAVWSYGGLAGALPVDLPARLVGAVRGFGLAQGFVDRFDEDWFDNPRAGTQIASTSAGPVWDGEAPNLATSPALLGGITRSFEELLG